MFQDVMTEILKSFDLQPLQDLATMRVAISVCEAEDMQDMMRTFRKPDDQGRAVAFSDNQWKQLCSKGRKKLVRIGTPRLLIDVILERLLNISFEIFKWIVYHEDTGMDCSSTFCWTRIFTIDYLKTAQMLTENDELDIKQRFKLACLYCLESEVRSLWRMMTVSERRFFFGRGNLKKSDQSLIVLYWTYFIQEVPIDYWDCKALLNHTELYKYSVINGYLNATEFFLHKLKGQHRNRMISNSFCVHLRNFHKPKKIVKDHLAIAFFLICQLPSVSDEITYYHTFGWVFMYFLEWPFQKHFMTVVNRLRDHMYDITFAQILEAIFEKEMEGFRDYDYKDIFKEFWRQGSVNCKSRVNSDLSVGSKILFSFVDKHFGFVFEEQSFTLKRKFRSIVFQQDASEKAPYFEQENVEFFKFLVLEQVSTKSWVRRFSRRRLSYIYPPGLEKYVRLPLGELTFLIDGLLATT